MSPKWQKKKNMELVYVHTNLSSLTQQGHEAMSSSHSLIKDVREKNRRPAKAYRAEHTFTEKHQGTTQTLLSLFTLKISQMLKAGAGQRMEHCVSFSHHSLQRIYELNTSCLSYILWLPFRQQWVAFLLTSCGQCPIRCRTHPGHWDVLVNIWTGL